MGVLENMINENKIDLNQYFVMHPFSATERILYDQALKDMDFFDKLYIMNNNTYERLATVCNVVNNAGMNLIVITGYRGCGKTNFLRLIENLAKGNMKINSLAELCAQELERAQGNEELCKTVRSNYEQSVSRICTAYGGRYSNLNQEEVYCKFSECIIELLNGECKYINFDEGCMGRAKPFSGKLFYLLRRSIDECVRRKVIDPCIALLERFVERNKWVIEENIDSEGLISEFLKNAKVNYYRKKPEGFYGWLRKEWYSLSLEQVLFIYTLWEYTETIVSGKQNKQIYLLDNIDIIADGMTDIFQNTMMGIWKFIWDTRNLFADLRDSVDEEDKCFLDLYDNTKFIVAMRETTAMHISGHLRDKMRGLMEHFDMSADIDKTSIMQKRIELALNMIEKGRISNREFMEVILCISRLVQDRVFMRNLFLLYNNDYRTAMMSIITICVEHLNELKKAIELVESGEKNAIFGGRGILYRLLINAFFDWQYYSAIGVSDRNYNNKPIVLQRVYGYSCSRIILTLLCNKQVKVPNRFFVNPEESVRLADLFSMMQNIISIDDFVNIIDGMYSLRNKKYWNHLVTFDNILGYSSQAVKESLMNSRLGLSEKQNHEIYIRATSAGQFCAGVLCVHFEYFASRFATGISGLFLMDNIGDGNVINSIKRTVSEVFEAVKECCKNLEEYNRLVLKSLGRKNYEGIVASPYYYEKQFHEERIIHSHISYLEAYRRYVLRINGFELEKNELNKYLVSTIEKYLDLLKYDAINGYKTYRDEFISHNSKQLYNELSVCIEEIREVGYKKVDMEITRDYYRARFSGKLCSFIRKNGISMS